MSRLVSIRLTDDVLDLVDACVAETKGNRSSFIRDACLHYAKAKGPEDVTFVKLKQDNCWKLKQIASKLNLDHDILMNQLLETMFEQIDPSDPFATMEESP